MDMSQQASFGSRQEQRAAVELARPPGVVEERGREQEVGRRRWWSCAASRQSEATPTVCSSSPPAHVWWLSWVAGRMRRRARKSAS